MLERLNIISKANMYSLLAVVLLMMGVFGGSNSQASANENSQRLVPLPQQMNTADGELNISPQVNIVGAESADSDAVRILKEFLSENNITVNEEFNALSTTIALGEVDNLSSEVEALKEELTLADASKLNEEGYLLKVDLEASEGGIIYLQGADKDGTFYAVKTLIQLIDFNSDALSAQNLEILDEPSMDIRGIVEGFYGDPWSSADRLDQIRFYGDYKMNTYIYAPKDDPYHRSKWREPYPESEMERMEELINTAKENKVDFVFAISPGNDIKFDGQAGEDDFQALLVKSESLYEMGVRNFAILFDDISNKEGDKQAKVLNRFNEEFIKAKPDVNPVITVPTEYDTRLMGGHGEVTEYTTDFSKTLDEDIKVMWTGQAIVSTSLPLENYEFVQSVYGDRIGLWWNYPVTDYMKSKLALGPIVDIDARLAGKLNFFVMNPMEHANLSKISLATGADYSWNTTEYDADQSWEQVIELLFPTLSEEMKTFANHSTQLADEWTIGREDAKEIRESIDRLWLKISTMTEVEEEVAILKQEFSDMIEASNVLKENLPPAILGESAGNLDKLKLLGENGQLALDLVLAQMNEDTETYDELHAKITDNLSELNSGSRVSERTVLAFIQEALDFDPLPFASFNVSKTLVLPGEEVKFESTSSLTAVNLEWTFEGAQVEHSTDKNPTVIYDEEGIYTVKLVGKNTLGEDVVIKEDMITVSNLASQDTVNLSFGKTATASSSCADDEGAQHAIDGSLNTKWCANGSEAHTLDIDLGGINFVSEIIMKHAEAGLESANVNTSDYRVLISEDGENYTELIQVEGNKAGVTEDQVPARKGRYIRLIIDKPTQGDGGVTRIYEFEAMGLEGDVELPGDVEVPEDIDKTALETVIAKATSLNKADYTSKSWANLAEALADAQALLVNEEATQTAVDAAVKTLGNAIDTLEKVEIPAEPVDKVALETVIAKATALNEADYTAESWANLAAVLVDAQSLLVNEEATQTAIDAAVKDLGNAMDRLEKAEVPDNNGSDNNDQDGGVTINPDNQDTEKDDGNKLPSTATNIFNILGLGFLFLLVGVSLIFVKRRIRA